MKTAEQINEETRVIAGASAVACEVEGEMILLDVNSGTYFGLNRVGAEIWNYIREERSVSEVQQHLLSQYDVAPARCLAEVAAVIGQLSEKGLVSAR